MHEVKKPVFPIVGHGPNLLLSARAILLADGMNIHAPRGLIENVRLNAKRFDCGLAQGLIKPLKYEYEIREAV